jgi:hypothetical protein
MGFEFTLRPATLTSAQKKRIGTQSGGKATTLQVITWPPCRLIELKG